MLSIQTAVNSSEARTLQLESLREIGCHSIHNSSSQVSMSHAPDESLVPTAQTQAKQALQHFWLPSVECLSHNTLPRWAVTLVRMLPGSCQQ